MKFHLEISEYCKQDVIHSAQWYAFRQPGLDKKFISEFEATIELIGQNPEIGRSTALEMRRFPIQIFPYALYYQIGADVIRIIACLHGARQPSDIERELEERK